MCDLKLVYFDLRGRAEPIRMMMALAGKEYEDVRISFDQWPGEEKAKSPYGSLPYMVYKGNTYGQSLAMCTFVANEEGLRGKDNLEALRVDEVVALGEDIQNAFYKAYFNPEKKAEMLKDLYDNPVPKYLGYLQKLLQKNGSNGCFVGSSVTLADVFTFCMLDLVAVDKADLAGTYPDEVKKMRANVESQPKLKAYLASRKQTML